jgi:hypothetical protein
MKKARMLIDIIMFVLFIILMGYHITGNKLHEILGIITFILFIIHHVLNRKWYKALPKGKYNGQRIVSTIVDFLLIIDMLCIMISAIMISTTVFSFLNIKTNMIARSMHLSSTAWGLILIGIHLGLHLRICFDKIRKKIKTSSFEYTFYLIILLLLIYGIYAFIKNAPWQELFLLTHFKFFDYEQLPIFFYLEYLGITFLTIMITYSIMKVTKKRSEKK